MISSGVAIPAGPAEIPPDCASARHAAAAPIANTAATAIQGLIGSSSLTNWHRERCWRSHPATCILNAPRGTSRKTLPILLPQLNLLLRRNPHDRTAGATVRTGCPADLTGSSDPNDPTYGQPDGDADGDDFFFYLDLFAAGCN